MKKTLFCALVVFSLASFAKEIQFNGNFENATANKQGILWPKFWHKTIFSKETSIRLTKEPDEVQNGKFALFIEQETAKSVANVRYLTSFPANLKDKVKATLYVKGTGKLQLMRIIYEGETGKFLRTIGFGKIYKVDSPDKWVKFEFNDNFPPLKARGKLIEKYKFLPVFNIVGEAELLIDNMTMEIIEPTAPKAAK
jgi:hypothetical protein